MSEKLLDGLIVSRETINDLRAFEDLVLKWTTRINLISKNSLDDIWKRHICDSAQLYLYRPQNVHHWVDLGSGGGFPGVVVAILAKHLSKGVKFTFIESDQRKAVFLRTAIRELGLSAKVIVDRIENVDGQNADVVTARALMPLSELLQPVSRHMNADGLALLPKGERADEEIKAAMKNWRFDLDKKQSIVDEQSYVLSCKRISRIHDK